MFREIADLFGFNRVSKIWCKTRRIRMAESMAKSSQDMTQVECIDHIRSIEDKLLEETEQDLDGTSEYLIRITAQESLINYLEQREEDE